MNCLIETIFNRTEYIATFNQKRIVEQTALWTNSNNFNKSTRDTELDVGLLGKTKPKVKLKPSKVEQAGMQR